MNELVQIKNLIYTIRGYRVMLDSDLAMLYGVETKRLHESVKRNIDRFPSHYMFQLTKEEWLNLRSQIATFSNDIRKYTPYVFTEQGVAMLSSVLNSKTDVYNDEFTLTVYLLELSISSSLNTPNIFITST